MADQSTPVTNPLSSILDFTSNLIGGIIGISSQKRAAQQANLDREYNYYATERSGQQSQWNFLTQDSKSEVYVVAAIVVIAIAILIFLIMKNK